MKEQIRIWLAARLRRNPESDPVFRKLWKMLHSEGHVDIAVQMCVTGDRDFAEHAKTDLLRVARMLLPYAESEVGSPRPTKVSGKKRRKIPLQLDNDYGKERAEILGEYLALRSSLHPLVRRFRKEVLGGEAVTPEQARTLVDSSAASRFPISRFRKEGIPLVGHTAWFYEHGAVFKGPRADAFIEYEYIFIDPPGRIFRTHLPVSVAYTDLEYLWFLSGRATNDAPYSFVESDGEYFPTPVYPGSVLDRLRQVSQKLVNEYAVSWDEGQAAWFVLTDEPVAPKVLTATYEDHYSEHLTRGTITISVEPWMPKETVAMFYQYLQNEMLGRKLRAPERRNMAMLRFVIRHSRAAILNEEDRGELFGALPWGVLMERWNQENPHQVYTKESRFRRDVERGGRALLSPYERPQFWERSRLTIP